MPKPSPEIGHQRDIAYLTTFDRVAKEGRLIRTHDVELFFENGLIYWQGIARHGRDFYEQAAHNVNLHLKALKGNRRVKVDFFHMLATQAYASSYRLLDESVEYTKEALQAGTHWEKQAELLEAEL